MAERATLFIIGAGGHGRVAADIASVLGYNKISFIDQCWPTRKENAVWPIVGNGLSDIPAKSEVFVAIGDNAQRLASIELAVHGGISLVTLIHPSAHVSARAKIGAGSIVMANAIVNIGSDLGLATIVNTGATIDHDCVIGKGVHISPGANIAGGVSIGERTWIGIGACVKQGVKIGKDTMIGAGAVVVRDIPDNVVAFGNPARVQKAC